MLYMKKHSQHGIHLLLLDLLRRRLILSLSVVGVIFEIDIIVKLKTKDNVSRTPLSFKLFTYIYIITTE